MPTETTEAPAAPRTLQELEARQDIVRGELLGLSKKETLDGEEQSWNDSLLTEYDDLDGELKPLLERRAKMERILYSARGGGAGAEKVGTPDLFVQQKTDPFENLDAIRRGTVIRSEVRGRGLDVVERAERLGQLTHDRAEWVTRLAQDNVGIARHAILTGSDEYAEAFQAYIENPEENVQRAALALTLANGGYMLPFVLDPTIVLTNAGSANPWRRIAAVKQTTSNTWNGVTSAGVNAAWLAEGTEDADHTPTIGNVQITPQKASAWVFGSYEVLADTDFAQQLPMLLGDAKDRLEEQAFATGTGTGQPQGVLTGSTTTVNTGTTLAYGVGDVYALQQAVPARFRNSPAFAWVLNVSFINKTRQFDTAGGASFWTNLGKGQPETLLGAPIYESTTMFGGAQAVGSLIAIAGDFNQYYIVDRVGVSLMYEPMVKGAGTKPTGQAGWFMFWRAGAQVAVPTAFRVLRGL